MALDERYVVASDLEQYFVDKDSGLPLANGTLTFYRDVARNVPKEVFQLSGAPPNYGYTSMGAQITLSAVGTVQNSGGDNEVIYYYPYDVEGNLDLYYVVCRNADGIEQFTREAWPNITSANDPTKDQTGIQNQLSNPTFTNVFINANKTTTYTVTAASNQVFEFAPNWDFVISGTGTVIIERVAITGNENVPTSPPYVLDVQVSVGVTACYLRQRFPYNSGLWASTPNHPLFLSGSFVARNESVGTTGIQMFYVESTGGSPVVVVDGTFESNYQIIQGATSNAIPQSTNTDSGKDGYIDIYLSFISGSHVRLTALQVIPSATNSINIIPHDTNSSNREEAYQGDYYIPRCAAKPTGSFLIGWDFQLNPFQFGFSGNVATTAAYIVDQTIALRGASGNVAWDYNTATYGLRFTTAGTNDAFYIMQYLDNDQVKDMIGRRLSANVFAYTNSGVGAVTMRIYLFRAGSAAAFPTLPTSIGTVASDGTFTLTAANWTTFARSGLDTPQAVLNQLVTAADINDGNNDYGFSGWEITDSAQIADTSKFAMVVTFAYADAGTEVTVNSVSLTPGDLPCRPLVKSLDEVLRQCQYYYEQTTDPGTHTPTGAANGSIVVTTPLVTSGGNDLMYLKSFYLGYKAIKRALPTVTFFSDTSATPNLIKIAIHLAGGGETGTNVSALTGWTKINPNLYGFLMYVQFAASVATTATNPANEGIMQFHYTADARLGVV